MPSPSATNQSDNGDDFLDDPVRDALTAQRSNSPYGESSSYRNEFCASSNRRSLYRRAIYRARELQWECWRFYDRLTPAHRALVTVAAILVAILGILAFAYHEQILRKLEPVAEDWRNSKSGWLILFVVTFLFGFPPLIGYGTCVTVAGFVFGFPNGWFIVAPATVLGSTASFLVSRSLLSGYVSGLVSRDKRFKSLSLVLQNDGLKLLVMIRLCPLPYSFSNGAIAMISTVTWPKFALATAIITPKLLTHVFIGDRIAALARHGGEMDLKTQLINYGSIAFSLLIGSATGYIIWRRTSARARELEDERSDDVEEQDLASLPPDYTDEPA